MQTCLSPCLITEEHYIAKSDACTGVILRIARPHVLTTAIHRTGTAHLEGGLHSGLEMLSLLFADRSFQVLAYDTVPCQAGCIHARISMVPIKC